MIEKVARTVAAMWLAVLLYFAVYTVIHVTDPPQVKFTKGQRVLVPNDDFYGQRRGRVEQYFRAAIWGWPRYLVEYDSGSTDFYWQSELRAE